MTDRERLLLRGLAITGLLYGLGYVLYYILTEPTDMVGINCSTSVLCLSYILGYTSLWARHKFLRPKELARNGWRFYDSFTFKVHADEAKKYLTYEHRNTFNKVLIVRHKDNYEIWVKYTTKKRLYFWYSDLAENFGKKFDVAGEFIFVDCIDKIMGTITTAKNKLWRRGGGDGGIVTTDYINVTSSTFRYE